MDDKSILFSQIVDWHVNAGGEVINFGLSDDHRISAPRSIEICNESNITMLTVKFKDDVDRLLTNTKSQLIIIPKELLPSDFKSVNKAFLIHNDPKKILIQFCHDFLNFGTPNQKSQIHPSSIIEEGATLGENCVIGANVFVSGNTIIKSNCSIGPNTVIKNAIVGNGTIIGSNNTIGGDGFGYAQNEYGEYVLFPHYGSVIIQDRVHIGNNTCIDRGSLSDTLISEGAKIDNLVHIAHNVVIGKNSLIIACSMVAGSVVIGDNCWVAPASTIRNNLSIGENTTVGMGSVVTKNISNGQTVMGNPAVSFEDFVILRNDQKSTILKHMNKKK